MWPLHRPIKTQRNYMPLQQWFFYLIWSVVISNETLSSYVPNQPQGTITPDRWLPYKSFSFSLLISTSGHQRWHPLLLKFIFLSRKIDLRPRLPTLSFRNHRHVHNNTSCFFFFFFFFHFHVVCYLPIARRVCNIIVVSLGEEDWRGNQPSTTGSQELMPRSRKATATRFRARETRQRTDEEDASRVTDDPRSPLAPRAGRHRSVWLGRLLESVSPKAYPRHAQGIGSSASASHLQRGAEEAAFLGLPAVMSMYTSADVTAECSQLFGRFGWWRFLVLFFPFSKKNVSMQLMRVQDQHSAQHERRTLRNQTIFYRPKI